MTDPLDPLDRLAFLANNPPESDACESGWEFDDVKPSRDGRTRQRRRARRDTRDALKDFEGRQYGVLGRRA